MPDTVDQEVLSEVISQISSPSIPFFDLASKIRALHDQDRTSLTALSKRTEVGNHICELPASLNPLAKRHLACEDKVGGVGFQLRNCAMRHRAQSSLSNGIWSFAQTVP